MTKNRLEAFSDGVLAILITIMVLELKVPHGDTFAALRPLIPVFLSYVLSFVYIGIYWNNHHHMLHTVRHVSGAILWANMHLLFWLSLVPFATGWLGEFHESRDAVLFYGFILLMCGVAYWILQETIIRGQGENSLLKRAIGYDVQGKLSPILYTVALVAAGMGWLWGAIGLFVVVALIWLVPDRRIERLVSMLEDE